MPPTLQTRISPDGRFRIEIHTIEHQGRGHSKEVDVFDRMGRLVGRTYRNFHRDEIFHFIQQDGKDYLILSENYHGGYGCMDLQTGEKMVFNPASLTSHEQHWIWLAPAAHDPEAKTLTITGCYWAGPFEQKTFDFSHPLQAPYEELSCISEEDD